MQKYPLQNILVEACTNSGKIVEGKVTGNDGQVYFRNDNKIKKIVVSDMYYDDITIDCTPGKNYLVTLAENEIIETAPSHSAFGAWTMKQSFCCCSPTILREEETAWPICKNWRKRYVNVIRLRSS